MASTFRRVLFNVLDFESYLYILSKLYFISYRLGLLKGNPMYAYHYFIPKLLNEGDHVIDIGANLGYYSVLFARKVGSAGKVYSVEPIQPILSVLRKNLSPYHQVEILPVALGSEEKVIRLGNDSRQRLGYIASGSHSVVSDASEMEGDKDYFEASMKKGSELFGGISRLDFIKCDIEGHETVVIPEMKSVIEKFKPSMLIETKRDKRVEMIRFLEDLDYHPFELGKDERLLPASPTGSDDILFIHAERMKGSFIAARVVS